MDNKVWCKFCEVEYARYCHRHQALDEENCVYYLTGDRFKKVWCKFCKANYAQYCPCHQFTLETNGMAHYLNKEKEEPKDATKSVRRTLSNPLLWLAMLLGIPN